LKWIFTWIFWLKFCEFSTFFFGFFMTKKSFLEYFIIIFGIRSKNNAYFALNNLISPWPNLTHLTPLAATRGRSRFFHTSIRNQEIKFYQIRHEYSKNKIQKNLADTLAWGFSFFKTGLKTDLLEYRIVQKKINHPLPQLWNLIFKVRTLVWIFLNELYGFLAFDYSGM
jgi:hypothetical protein